VPDLFTSILFCIHSILQEECVHLVRDKRSDTKKTDYARQEDSNFCKNAAVTLIWICNGRSAGICAAFFPKENGNKVII